MRSPTRKGGSREEAPAELCGMHGTFGCGSAPGLGVQRDAHGAECLGEVEQSCERSGQTVGGGCLTLDEWLNHCASVFSSVKRG